MNCYYCSAPADTLGPGLPGSWGHTTAMCQDCRAHLDSLPARRWGIGLVLLALIIALAIWPFVAYLVVAGVAGYFIYTKLLRRRIRRWRLAREMRRAQERERIARLVRNATVEHERVQEGRLEGFYGEFPPPPDLRGMGFNY